jgi:hypothetical protein
LAGVAARMDAAESERSAIFGGAKEPAVMGGAGGGYSSGASARIAVGTGAGAGEEVRLST